MTQRQYEYHKDMCFMHLICFFAFMLGSFIFKFQDHEAAQYIIGPIIFRTLSVWNIILCIGHGLKLKRV